MLYNKYKSKGFEIIGASDDDSEPDKWRAAVDKDGIAIWKHVLRGLRRLANNEYDRKNALWCRIIDVLPKSVYFFLFEL